MKAPGAPSSSDTRTCSSCQPGSKGGRGPISPSRNSGRVRLPSSRLSSERNTQGLASFDGISRSRRPSRPQLTSRVHPSAARRVHHRIEGGRRGVQCRIRERAAPRDHDRMRVHRADALGTDWCEFLRVHRVGVDAVSRPVCSSVCSEWTKGAHPQTTKPSEPVWLRGLRLCDPTASFAKEKLWAAEMDIPIEP
jgi:hypothetical protein